MPAKSSAKKNGGWNEVRNHLASWDKPALLSLVKDLYDVTSANRDFIQARCQAEDGSGDVLEKYRGKVVEPFFPKRGEGKLELAEARKAIRDYRKATGNLVGTAELLLTYVESGAKFTRRYGDIHERFYNSLESALTELATLLRKDAPELYTQFSQRLEGLVRITSGMGWGFHDFIDIVVAELAEDLGGQHS